MSPVVTLRALLMTTFATAFAASAYAEQVRGRVLDPAGLPLPGVAISLTRQGAPPATVITDMDGSYAVDIPAGRYSLRAELPGFEPVSVDILVSQGSAVVHDLTMKLAARQEEVDVVASSPAVLGSREPSDGMAIGRAVIDNAQVPNNRFEDVLPLLPSVVRGPDGLIHVAGARAPQGALMVNGVRETDPVTGQFAATVPLAAVQAVEVRPTSASAEYGNAVGGITQVQTRSGGDRWRASISSLDPRPHIVRGWIRSIDAWEPNGGVRGPIARGRLWLAQSFDYRYERTWFDTRVGREPTRLHGLASLTQLDAQIREGHLLTTWFSFYPQTITHATLGAFTPAPTTPNLHTDGWSATAIDRMPLSGTTILESRFQAKRIDVSVSADNAEPYRVGHDLVHGGYFNEQARTAYRLAWDESYAGVFRTGAVDHEMKAGLSASSVSFEGTSVSRPVELLRSDGALARTVEFQGAGALNASARYVGVFVQDTLRPSSALRIDAGVRFDANSLAAGARFSPRVGVSYSWPDDRTTVSGSVGSYGDKVLLAAGAFAQQQQRVVTSFDDAGTAIARVAYRNVTGGRLRAPGARAWHLQIDRRLPRGWMTRIKYQERHGYDELAVSPVDLTATTGEMVLASGGQSRSRSVEATVGRRTAGHEMYLSYVRSSSRGNLNDLNAVEGNFKLALVQPDQVAPLAADVPHRLLMWGIVKLPRRITIAPFFELRSGFPYSAIDDQWNEFGRRNSLRFPAFASLDLVASKVVEHLPFKLPPARIGIKLYNVTGRFNGRDVQRDIARPDFGAVYNPVRRQLRGIFEFMWGGEK